MNLFSVYSSDAYTHVAYVPFNRIFPLPEKVPSCPFPVDSPFQTNYWSDFSHHMLILSVHTLWICTWLLLFSMMFLRFIHVVACIGSFLKLRRIQLYGSTIFTSLFSYWGTFGLFQVGVTQNEGAINILIQCFLWTRFYYLSFWCFVF